MMNDLISRQAAIDVIRKCNVKEVTPAYRLIDKAEALMMMTELPTAHRPVDEWCTDCSEYDTERKCCPRFNRVIRTALDDSNTPNTLEALERRWIPVTERLPEKSGSYLTYLHEPLNFDDAECDWGFVTEMYFDMGQMLWKDNSESFNAVLSAVYKDGEYFVSHWMPLPESPKEEHNAVNRR